MFPYWSDLMGPLLAHGAELTVAGGPQAVASIDEYIENRDLRRHTLITSIRLPDLPWQGAYYRHTRTPTDRPGFSITVLLRRSARRIEQIRVVVVGCTGRFRRLTGVEKLLEGVEVPSNPRQLFSQASEQLEIDFPARMGFSPGYLGACAAVELRRTLIAAFESTQGRAS
jgi:CO/xanthine dehydrogenase FAD-binding subunit